ncbi:MAG: prohibitin family protein [Synechococcales cyanobacterium RU_4_20]|nr:prohibitin family protein [Synechococcales cyanobacterium RU_4_20]NJR68017.1 prohibitin family protein [Synechococcales cyanobacterium CRU_2_2]
MTSFHRHSVAFPWGIAIALASGLAITTLAWQASTSTVEAGSRGVVMQFGKVKPQVLDEGLHWKMPLITRIYPMNVRVQKTDVDISVGTRDLQSLQVQFSLNWHVVPEKANQVYQQIGSHPQIVEIILKPAIEEVVKASTPKRTLEETLKDRSMLKDEIEQAIRDRLAPYHLVVDDASLVNVGFSPEFTQSIEAKQIAEQEAQKAKYLTQKAEQEAKAEITRAKGQAEAQRLLQQSLTPELLQKQAIDKWNGQFPQVMTGEGTTPLLDLRSLQKSP